MATRRAGPPVRVVLCDDHVMFRQMVAGRLDLMADLEVVGEAEEGLESIALTRELRPDVVVMDLGMPGGLDGLAAVRRLTEEVPESRVLVLSGSEEEENVVGAVDRGAYGYVIKTGGVDELCEAIRQVGEGRRYFSSRAGALMANRIARGDPRGEGADLGERDLHVLQLAVDGLTYKEIGRRVSLSERRIKDILSLAADKLGAANRANLIALAVSKGLVSVDEPPTGPGSKRG